MRKHILVSVLTAATSALEWEYGPYGEYGKPLDVHFVLNKLENPTANATWEFDLVSTDKTPSYYWEVERPLRNVYFTTQSGKTFTFNVKDETPHCGTQNPWGGCEAMPTKHRDKNALPTAYRLLQTENKECLQSVAGWLAANWRLWRTSSKGPTNSVASRLSRWLSQMSATRFPPQTTDSKGRKLSAGQLHSTFRPVDKQQPKMVLLSTHNRLFWYNTEVHTEHTVMEGRGIYYGVFAGDPDPYVGPTLWVVSRPHNWQPTSTKEHLLQLAADGSGLMKEVEIPTKFAHDAVRSPDGKKVFVASTGTGAIVELDYATMTVTKEHKVFTPKDHINSLSIPYHHDESRSDYCTNCIWALLHGKGARPSRLSLVDLNTDKIIKTIDQIGEDAHGANNHMSSKDGEYNFLTLSSKHGQIVRLKDTCKGTDCVAKTEVLYTDADKHFAKGFSLVGDVAYVGSSVGGPRNARDSFDKQCTLTAVEVSTGKVLWRKDVNSRGLLNVVSAPHLDFSATYLPFTKWEQSVPSGFEADYEKPSGRSLQPWYKRLRSEVSKRPNLKFNPVQEKVDAKKGVFPKTVVAQLGQIPYELIAPLQDFFRSEKSKPWSTIPYAHKYNADFPTRAGNLEKFKPGVGDLKMIFSNQLGNQIHRFPWFRTFMPHILPILRWFEIPVEHVVRMQFSIHGSGGMVRKHRDLGPWVQRCHRTHIPITTSPVGDFSYKNQTGDWVPIDLKVGKTFEINNHVEHYVHNPDNFDSRPRIHLIVDWADDPMGENFVELKPGGMCKYGHNIECPDDVITKLVIKNKKNCNFDEKLCNRRM